MISIDKLNFLHDKRATSSSGDQISDPRRSAAVFRSGELSRVGELYPEPPVSLPEPESVSDQMPSANSPPGVFSSSETSDQS